VPQSSKHGRNLCQCTHIDPTAHAHADIARQVDLDLAENGRHRFDHIRLNPYRQQLCACRLPAMLEQSLLIETSPIEQQTAIHIISPRNGRNRHSVDERLFDNPPLLGVATHAALLLYLGSFGQSLRQCIHLINKRPRRSCPLNLLKDYLISVNNCANGRRC